MRLKKQQKKKATDNKVWETNIGTFLRTMQFGVCPVAFLSDLRKLASVEVYHLPLMNLNEMYHLPLIDLTQLTQGLSNELRSRVRYV